MINIRKQIYSMLSDTGVEVKMTQPSGDIILPLIVYAEITNVNISMRQDRLEYQVDVYHDRFDDCLLLAQHVDYIMTRAGWHRTYKTPDTNAKVKTGLYKIALSYTARVDTLKNEILTAF